MRRPFASIAAGPDEVAAGVAGDDIVAAADVVMDRAFVVDAEPADVWPWLVQLGKGRAGWYLPRRVERLLPPGNRAARRIEPRWQQLQVGDVVPDYGGAHATFELAVLDPPTTLVFRSQRGRVHLSWAITLTPLPTARTRVHLRLRLGPVKHVRLAETAGGLFDAATIAGMAAGLRERLRA
ncbi:MAG TPA: hypothetical protein VGN18_00370 [Jatrophihabitans sp.]|uniref:SRPBCC family protein n=1 Tax=Jatrophihabitans sp. TaxID=1932789 RepID=UPI002DFCDABA|nr:hypothetical protein [Jatrophihabitans sp.]